MHIICSNAAGYVRYITTYKCDDKQGEIARQVVRIEELEREAAALRADNERLRAACEETFKLFNGWTSTSVKLLIESARSILDPAIVHAQQDEYQQEGPALGSGEAGPVSPMRNVLGHGGGDEPEVYQEFGTVQAAPPAAPAGETKGDQ